ncbi:MAG: thioredoxin family protein [Bacteroidales bacterium]|nr:thioredoxin family protein [Bacteroidales bacterium]
MKKNILFIMIMLASTMGLRAQQKPYDETIDAMVQIETAISEANATGRYVLCQVGGNWCPWCIRFADFASTDSVIAPLVAENYVYIHVNYSKANKNEEAMQFLGKPGRFGYPVFVVINDKGVPIHIQESESLEEGKSYNRKRVEKFLRLWSKKAVEED